MPCQCQTCIQQAVSSAAAVHILPAPHSALSRPPAALALYPHIHRGQQVVLGTPHLPSGANMKLHLYELHAKVDAMKAAVAGKDGANKELDYQDVLHQFYNGDWDSNGPWFNDNKRKLGLLSQLPIPA